MQVQQDFIVIDTEGKNELWQIAIIDSQGQLVYEAFAKGHPKNDERYLNVKPLREIVRNFLTIAQNKLIIFHYAKHDLQVLKRSFIKVGLPWEKLTHDSSLNSFAFVGLLQLVTKFDLTVFGRNEVGNKFLKILGLLT